MDKQMDNIFNVKHDDFDTNDYTFAEADPFNKSWDELREFNGLDKNFKRKTTRQGLYLLTGTADLQDSIQSPLAHDHQVVRM